MEGRNRLFLCNGRRKDIFFSNGVGTDRVCVVSWFVVGEGGLCNEGMEKG